MRFFADYFWPLYSCRNTFLSDCLFYNNCIYFLFCFLFFLDSSSLVFIATVFLGISGFVIILEFWYAFTFSMSELLWLVTLYPASCSGTLVLGFYAKVFLSSIDIFGLDFLFVQSYFTEILSQIILIVKGWYSSSNSYSRMYMMFFYSSGYFNRTWVILS